MKKEKGFTLIELLAVIVILAIILVIAAPKILDVIEKSKMESFRESAGLMADAAKITYASNKLSNSSEATEYIFEEGDYSSDSPKLNFKGDKPYSGVIKVNKDGRVSLALISKDKKYCATKEYKDSVKVKLDDGICETNDGLVASAEKEVIPDLAYISKDYFKTAPVKSISFKKSSDAPTTYNSKSDISKDSDGSVYNYMIVNPTTSGYTIDMIITSDKKISVPEKTMEGMFSNLKTLQSISFENFDTSTITNMKNLFENCENLKSIEYLSNFNTSKVTDFSRMFYGCIILPSLDVSNFNTSRATTLSEMFYNCNIITSLDVSNFNTSRVTNFSGMFGNCKALTSLDVSKFDTSKATDVSSMFSRCILLKKLNVSKFNTSNVTTMGGMFFRCELLSSIDVTHFDTSNVTEFAFMFSMCKSLTSLDLSNFDTSKATGFQEMLSYCTNLSKLDLSNFKSQNLIFIDRMFLGCTNLTEVDLSNLTSENIVYIGNLFKDCINLTKIDLSNFSAPKKIDYSNTLNHNSPLFDNTSSEMTIYVKDVEAQEYFSEDRTGVNSSYQTTFIIK